MKGDSSKRVKSGIRGMYSQIKALFFDVLLESLAAHSVTG